MQMQIALGTPLRYALVALAAVLSMATGSNDVVAQSAPPQAAPPPGREVVQRDAKRVPLKSYSVGGALALRDDVGYDFKTTAGPVQIDIGRITNESTTTTSGTIRAGLFVTSSPTPGEFPRTIAFSELGTLQPGFFFLPLSHTVNYIPPADGLYYLHMGVFEYEPGFCAAADGYCLDDYVTFANRVEVIGGLIYDAGPAPTTLAVEFFHARFGHYFLTSSVDEIRDLDLGRFEGWNRTGRSFSVWTTSRGDQSSVCRFFSASFAPKSSHFYTHFADECATRRRDPSWQFETFEAFYIEPLNFEHRCSAGTRPLYRLYNNGQGGAPNHRYTTDLDVRGEMLASGWTLEGNGPLIAIGCVPA